VLIGTSVGALNCVAVATEPSLEGVKALAEFWKGLSTSDVFPGGTFTKAWNILKRGAYLIDNTGLEKVIERATPARDFDDLQLPVRVVTTDLATGEEVVFCRGPLKTVLLASASLPGVFPPVRYDDRVLVDGGVVNSVPLWHAISDDIDEIYVLNVSGGGSLKNLRTPLDVITRAFSISRSQRFDVEQRTASANVYVLPRPVDRRDLYNFDDSAILIEEAYKQTYLYLDNHRLPRPEKKPSMFKRLFG
jgi:NTE family protein